MTLGELGDHLLDILKGDFGLVDVFAEPKGNEFGQFVDGLVCGDVDDLGQDECEKGLKGFIGRLEEQTLDGQQAVNGQAQNVLLLYLLNIFIHSQVHWVDRNLTILLPRQPNQPQLLPIIQLLIKVNLNDNFFQVPIKLLL